jgi:hypothetical protein
MDPYMFAACLAVMGFVLCVIPFAVTLSTGRVRVRAARRLDRFIIGTSAIALPVVMAVSVSDLSVPMWAPTVPMLGVPIALFVQVVAVTAYVVGLAWMVRIHRTSHLEPERSSWRYREVSRAILVGVERAASVQEQRYSR